MKRAARVAGALAAPWLFALSRIAASKRLATAAIRCDPSYVRALSAVCEGSDRTRLIFGQLQIALEIMAATAPAAHPTIKENISHSQSQLLQDILCLVVHQGKRNGYFVEIGVGDGVSISNTHLLEKHYDWTGLLVEPCRGFEASIRTNRKAMLDTRAAVRVARPPLEFREFSGAGEFSGLSSVVREQPTGGTDAISYMVETASLDQILAKAGTPSSIDYMSIDTEGSELEILAGLDLDRFRVGLFTIEHNERPGEVEALKRLLEPRGYVQILSGVSRYDAWFVHRNIDLDGIPKLP